MESRTYRSLIAAVCIGWLAFGVSRAQTGDTQTPLDVYGGLPTLENLILSPDGTKLAYVRTIGEQRNLYVHLLGQSQALGTVPVSDTKLRDIRWMDNDDLLIEISSAGLPPAGFHGPQAEWFELLTYNVPSQKLAHMNFVVKGEVTLNIIAGAPTIREVSGVSMLFVPGMCLTPRMAPCLFKYEIGTGQLRVIAKAGSGWTQWLIDESGRIGGEFIYHDQEKRWELKARKDDRMSVVASGTEAIDVPTVIGYTAVGDSILVQFIEDRDLIWKPLLLKDETWGTPLAKNEVYDRVIGDRKTGRIIGGADDLIEARYTFFDNELQAHWNAVLRAFPGERVDLLSHSDDFARILVRVFGPKSGYIYALFDWYSHRTVVLGKVYEGLESVAEVRPVRYLAADGLTISGFLTVPRGRAAVHLPLVVLPHGGPAAVDSGDFDWWAQALAAQGYAVFQPNYRGSTVNHRVFAAGFGEWGRKMQTDLSDGVRYLAEQGLIDPARVCIVGASYGGYAALAGISLDPGVYRCAVSDAGISDLKRFLNSTKFWFGDNLRQRYWNRFMGVSGPGDPVLRAISPIEHVNSVAGPVLLIHGRDDTVVPYEQSEIMAHALKHAGKTVDLVTLKHEDHWLSRGSTRLQMLQSTVEFLKANNPPN